MLPTEAVFFTLPNPFGPYVGVGRGDSVDDGARRILTADKRISDSAIRLQIALRQPFRNHQVSGALADVTQLEGRVVGDLLLYCKVPLIRHCRLNRSGPGLKRGTDIRIYAARRTERRRGVKRGLPGLDVIRFRLRRCIRRVLRVPQVDSRAFQVGRNREGAADDRLSAPERRAPGEAKAGLEIRQPVRRVVKPPTESIRAHNSVRYRIVAGKLQRASQDIYRGLTIVGFNPRSTRFITEAEV